MGSYCIACCATNQVIADYDKCQVLPILQESTYDAVNVTHGGQSFRLFGVANTACYPSAFWEPMGGFISATYTDRSRVALDDTPSNRRALLEFFKALLYKAPVVAQGKNPSRDVPFDIQAFVSAKAPMLVGCLQNARYYDDIDVSRLDFAELTAIWEYVVAVSEEHRLFAPNLRGHLRPVQFAAFHQESVNQLIAFTNQQMSPGGVPFELGAYLTHHVAKIVAESAPVGDEGPVKALSRQFALRSSMFDVLKLNLSDGVHGLLMPYMQDIHNLLEQHLDHGMPLDAFIEALRPITTGPYVLKAMDELNMKFSPIAYAGQDYGNSTGAAYAKFISGVADAVVQLRQKRYEE